MIPNAGPLTFSPGSGQAARVTMSAVTATSALATLSIPSGSTLVSWTLQYREAGSATWLDYAAGITATTKAVAGLGAETSYEFRGDDVVLSSATGTVRITTGAVVINWMSTNSFMTLKGTDVEFDSRPARAFSVRCADPGLPLSVGWGRLRIGAFCLGAGDAAYTDIRVALCDGGSAASPTLGGNPVTWVQATGIVAPPANDGLVPGAGPICDWLDIASTPTARGICVRVKRAAGNATFYVMGPGANYPTGVEIPAMIDGDPDLTSDSGWGESFGLGPAIYIEYDQLSSPVVRFEVFGDSQAQGYVNAGSGGKGPFGHAHDIYINGDDPKVVFTNLAKQGYGTAQISAMMRALAPVFGSKAILRQTQSTNDDDGTTDVTPAVVAASRAQFDSDASWLAGEGIGLIPFTGPGKSGWAAGAYGRFRTLYDGDWATTYPDTLDYVDGIVTDPTANGAPYPQYTDDDNHLTPTGQRAWATPMAPALVALLQAKGAL